MPTGSEVEAAAASIAASILWLRSAREAPDAGLPLGLEDAAAAAAARPEGNGEERVGEPALAPVLGCWDCGDDGEG